MSFFDEINIVEKKKRTENTTLKNGIEKWIENELKDQPYVYYKNWGGGLYNRAGRPDVEIAYKGIVSYWELKDPDGVLSTIQRHVIDKYKQAGIPIFVVDTVDEFIRLWKELYN